jgi:hypothetical protein
VEEFYGTITVDGEEFLLLFLLNKGVPKNAFALLVGLLMTLWKVFLDCDLNDVGGVPRRRRKTPACPTACLLTKCGPLPQIVYIIIINDRLHQTCIYCGVHSYSE